MKKILSVLAFFTFFIINTVPASASTIFSDTFTAPDGTELTAHNAEYAYPYGGSLFININRLDAGKVFGLPNTNETNYCASFDFVSNDNNAVIFLRANLANNEGYIGQLNGSGNYELRRWGAILQSGTIDLPAGEHTLKLCASGSALSFYNDNVLIASATDSTWSSGATYFYNDNSSSYYDNVFIETASGPSPTPTPTPLPNPSNTNIYVANDGSNNVSVIDGSTNTVTSTIPVGVNPRGVVVSPDGSRVYVANFEGTVSVIDASSHTVVTTIPVGSDPMGKLVINPAGTRVYVPNFSGNTVSVVNTLSNTVEATIPVGVNPFAAAISTDGQKLYVANQTSNTISVINTATNTVTASIPTGGNGSNGVIISTDSGKLYITNSSSSNVSVIDTATNSLLTTIPMSLGAYALEITPNGESIYVTNNNCCGNGNGTVTVIETDSNTVTAVIPVGGAPDILSISADGSRVYVPNNWGAFSPNGNTVSVIDTATNNVIETVTVGSNPFATATGQLPTTNAAPVIGSVTISPNPVTINTLVFASASFTDTNNFDTHTATVDWGNGSGSQACSVDQSANTVSCTLTAGYTTANVYPVTISVSDGTASATSSVVYASVFNPTQSSIFSGGQRFSNPATANINTTGNVTFGLNYRYQGSMTNTIRQFSMDFNAANLHFNATNVSTLIITNDFGLIQGTGTLNGASGYNFLVTGVDHGGIRIKITDLSNNVVYDTQNGASINATPTTTVNGQIIVN